MEWAGKSGVSYGKQIALTLIIGASTLKPAEYSQIFIILAVSLRSVYRLVGPICAA